jgi:hypothetical protein
MTEVPNVFFRKGSEARTDSGGGGREAVAKAPAFETVRPGRRGDAGAHRRERSGLGGSGA